MPAHGPGGDYLCSRAILRLSLGAHLQAFGSRSASKRLKRTNVNEAQLLIHLQVAGETRFPAVGCIVLRFYHPTTYDCVNQNAPHCANCNAVGRWAVLRIPD